MNNSTKCGVWADMVDIITCAIFSALEALRNALYKFKTYLLTYLVTTTQKSPSAIGAELEVKSSSL